MRDLLSVSAKYNGRYANGGGVDVQFAHKVLARVDKETAVGRLDSITEAMNEAKDNPEAKTRFGYGIVERAGRTAMREASFDESRIAGMASCEFDPEWLLKADPEDIVALAGIVVASRKVALEFHKIEICAINAD